MKIRGVIFVVIIICISSLGPAQANQESASARKNNQPLSAQMHVAPDLKLRLARFRQVQMPLTSAGLTTRERKMLSKLVDASRYLDDIYWRQVDPDGLELYESLEKSTDPK